MRPWKYLIPTIFALAACASPAPPTPAATIPPSSTRPPAFTPAPQPSALPPTTAPASGPVTLTLDATATVPDGQVWSGPVWDGQQIVVTYARNQNLWARRYDLNLTPIGEAVQITTDADPQTTDHKHIFADGAHYVVYSTPGDADQYLLKLDGDLNRLGFVEVVKGTTRERTNDMLLASAGKRIIVGRFCPCPPAGVGHVFAVFDENLNRAGDDVALLKPSHTNMGSITYSESAFHILAFFSDPGQASPSYLIEFDMDPTTLTALTEARVVGKDAADFLHASTGLVFDPARNQLAAQGNRPHLTLADKKTLVVGWDTPGVYLGVIQIAP